MVSSWVSAHHQSVMARYTPGSLVSHRSPAVYQVVPFSSGLLLQPPAARTDLLWTNPEEVGGIIKQEVGGRVKIKDLSTIQQFEALHLSAERESLYGWIVSGCSEECGWVCVGRGHF